MLSPKLVEFKVGKTRWKEALGKTRWGKTSLEKLFYVKLKYNNHSRSLMMFF